MGRPRIVGLGLAVVDHVYLVEGLELRAERTRYTERRVAAGGMTATALVQVAAVGCEAHLVSWVGDDPEGRFIRRSLRAAGVRTARLVLSPRASTTVAVVIVERRSGERRFLVADRRALERRAPRFDLDSIDARTVLLVDGHFPAQALRAVHHARRVGARVVGDFSDPRPEYLKLLPYVDHPVVPQAFADAYAGGDAQETLRRLRDRYGGQPVVTTGASGGLYLEGNRVRRYRAPRVRVRDTTGAGDVFHGAFAAALARGLAARAALELAARAAALCCTALGGTGRLMTRAEFNRGIRAAGAAPAARG